MSNKFIFIPLILLICVAVTVQLVNLTPLTGDRTSNVDLGTLPDEDVELPFGLGLQQTFTIIATVGFITLFASITILGILAGTRITILTNTLQLSEYSQKVIYNALTWLGIWGIFSTLATIGMGGIGGIFSIPIFGIFGYLFLTLLYVMGILKEINGSGN